MWVAEYVTSHVLTKHEAPDLGDSELERTMVCFLVNAVFYLLDKELKT